MTISNPFAYQQLRVVNPGIRSWNKQLSECVGCPKANGGIYSTKNWRAETLQPVSNVDNFKQGLWSGFPKEGVRTYRMAPIRLLTRQLFCIIHIHSLWLLLGFIRCFLRLLLQVETQQWQQIQAEVQKKLEEEKRGSSSSNVVDEDDDYCWPPCPYCCV